MMWFLKFLRLLPKGMMEFRREYKLSKKCQKLEDKHGPIVSAMYMYIRMDENVRPFLIRDLFNYVEASDYEEPNEMAWDWFLGECVKLGLLEKIKTEEPQTNEAWREWEMQE